MSLTRAQIQQQINQLTTTKTGYETNQRKYSDARGYANKLATDLKNAKTSTQSSIDYAKQYFLIDGKIGDGGKLEQLFNDINSAETKLNKVIVPAIDGQLRDLGAKIYQLESQISQLKRQLQQCSDSIAISSSN